MKERDFAEIDASEEVETLKETLYTEKQADQVGEVYRAALEVGCCLAGSFAAVLLADFGAEVLKVEEPRVGDLAPEDKDFGRLCRAMGREELASDPNVN